MALTDVYRLLTRAQFQAVLSGNTVAKTPHFALHHRALVLPGNDQSDSALSELFPVPGIWLGAMAPKRWAKRAVTRNAIKRQIYTVLRESKSPLMQGAYVVRLRSGFDRAQFVSASSAALKSAARTELVQLFSRVQAS